jgi:opacity protein-like surface antigen
MKKLLLAALIAVLPSIVPSVASAQGYVEGSIGFSLVPDVETDEYTFATPNGLFSGNGEIEFGAQLGFGIEGGFQTGRWRFGASADFISAELDTARLEGTLDGVPFSIEATDDELEDYGISGNGDISIFAGNAYYYFGDPNGGIQPYIGAGLGVATFDDLSSEFTFLATLGANVPIGQSAYLGGRYRLALITGPEGDNSGIQFNGITVHTFSFVIGFRFGG